MIKAVFFDNDGILIDTEPTWVQVNIAAFAKAGFPITEADYRHYNLTEGKGLTHFLPEKGFLPAEIQKICADRTAHYWDILPALEPMPHVEWLIEKLKSKGIQIGIVTAALKTDFERCHQDLDLCDHFDFIIVNDDTPRTKPHPDPYLLALEKAGVAPHEALVIEDSPRGVIAARAAGIERVVAVPTEMTRGGDFSQAWRVVDDLRAVVDLLNS